MAKITLPYILQNHNNADGGQVQDDFNAILAQVNGNLDGENVGNGAISLPKLASDVKVIENIYSIALSSDVTLPSSTTTTIFSQSLTLSTARYCLFLITGKYCATNDEYTWVHYLYDDSTQLESWTNLIYNTSSTGSNEASTFHYYGQLASGSHTIYLKALQGSSSELYELKGTRMTIIQFAF